MTFIKSELFLFLVGLAFVVCVLTPTSAGTTYPINIQYEPYLTEKERAAFVPEKKKISECKNSRDCRVMAEALVYEARSDSELAAVSVGFVILERVKTPHKWGDSVEEVVYKPYQFSYTLKPQRNIPGKISWDRGYALAWEILNGHIESPVDGATHYHHVGMKKYPKWAEKLEYIATVDSHHFYK